MHTGCTLHGRLRTTASPVIAVILAASMLIPPGYWVVLAQAFPVSPLLDVIGPWVATVTQW
jgi:hypothetical protein